MGPGIQDNDLKVFRELCQCSVIRGQDGAGIIQGGGYGKKFHTKTDKTGNEMAYLMWYNKHDKSGDRDLFYDSIDTFFLAHVRAATKGRIIKANAHPFEFDNLIGMHNGTLKECDYNPKGDQTDSEMMFADMDKKGIIPVLKSLHKDSAYAVVIFDKKTNEIIIARNEHRSLYGAWNNDRRVLYYASEAWMLEGVLQRNGIKACTPKYFKPHVVHQFDPWDVQKGKAPSWKTIDISPVKVTYNYTQGQGGPSSPLPEIPKSSSSGEEGTEKSSKKTEKLVFSRSKLHKSCISCYKNMDLLDQYRGRELADNNYLCQECSELFDDMDMYSKGKTVLLN